MGKPKDLSFISKLHKQLNIFDPMLPNLIHNLSTCSLPKVFERT